MVAGAGSAWTADPPPNFEPRPQASLDGCGCDCRGFDGRPARGERSLTDPMQAERTTDPMQAERTSQSVRISSSTGMLPVHAISEESMMSMAELRPITPPRAYCSMETTASEKLLDPAAAVGHAAREAVNAAFRDLAPTLVNTVSADLVRELGGHIRQLERLFARHHSLESMLPSLKEAVREVMESMLTNADIVARRIERSHSELSEESSHHSGRTEHRTSTSKSCAEGEMRENTSGFSAGVMSAGTAGTGAGSCSSPSSLEAAKVSTRNSFQTPTVQSLELCVMDTVLEQSGMTLDRLLTRSSRRESGLSPASVHPDPGGGRRQSSNPCSPKRGSHDLSQVWVTRGPSGSSAEGLSPDSGIGRANGSSLPGSPCARSPGGGGGHSAPPSPAAGASTATHSERQRYPQYFSPASSAKAPGMNSDGGYRREACVSLDVEDRGFSTIIPHSDSSQEDFVGKCSSMLSSKSGAGTRNMTGAQILDVRVQELTSEVLPHRSMTQSHSEGAESPSANQLAQPCPKEPLALRICGVLPWDEVRRPRLTTAIQWQARIVMAVAFAIVMFDTLSARENFWTAPRTCGRTFVAACWQKRGVFSQLPVGMGALVGVLLFGTSHRGRSLAQTFRLSAMMVRGKGFNERQQRQLRREKVVFLLAWTCNVAIFMVSAFHDVGLSVPSFGSAIHCLCLSMQSGVILCLTFSIGYVCRTLTLVVDLFCCDVLDTFQLIEVPHAWNVTQAVLRKASTSIELCLVTLCVTLAFAIPLLLVDVQAFGGKMRTVLILLPGFIITCGVFYVLLLAALVSEKCARVPALINALSFGPGTDRTRQHTVDYIMSSAAGFYVFGMRLTTAMVLKFMYTWSIIAIGLVTRLVSLD